MSDAKCPDCGSAQCACEVIAHDMAFFDGEPESPMDMYYQGPAFVPAPKELKDAARELLKPKPQADAAREWTIYHGMGASGISGPDTEKICVVARSAYDRVVAELAVVTAQRENAISNEGKLNILIGEERLRSAKLLSALKEIKMCKWSSEAVNPLKHIAREAIREYEKEST